MLRAVQDPAKHIILYGERGLGKTSLANIFSWDWDKRSRGDQPFVARIQAYPSDDFSSLWSRALKELRIAVQALTGTGPLRADEETQHEPAYTSPDFVRHTFEEMSRRQAGVIIIDEFDRLRDQNAREATANLVKCLHDYAINMTIILIGVANDVGELLAEHKSLRRALSLVKLQRMNVIDLRKILDTRLQAVPLEIADDARSEIVSLACGLPYYIQVLGKFAAQSATARNSTRIEIGDVNSAMQNFLVDAGQLFANEYDQATASQHPGNLFQQILLASALASADADGFFETSGVVKILGLFTLASGCNERRVQQYLAQFTRDRRGGILIRSGAKPEYRYRFSDALMQPFIIIRAIRDKMLDDTLRASLLRAGARQLEGGGYRLGVAEAYAAQLGMITPTTAAEAAR